ncbi:MAG: transposase [Bacteroidales bacterium]|nr:transposase [Bacteroidales bacterium]
MAENLKATKYNNGDPIRTGLNQDLLSELCVSGKEALLKYLKAATEKDITPGIIAVIQSFGSRINFHPHLHFLITEGGTG